MVKKIEPTLPLPAPPAGPAPAPPDGLEALAREAQVTLTPPPLGDGFTDLDVAARAEQAEAAQAEAMLAKLEKGVEKVIFGGLRAWRSKLAVKNEFLLTEWPDELLHAPAEAAVPVIRKRLGLLFAMAGNYPEESVLAMAAMPLILGYFAADEKRAALNPKTAAPAVPVPAAGVSLDANAGQVTRPPEFGPNDPRSITLNGG